MADTVLIQQFRFVTTTRDRKIVVDTYGDSAFIRSDNFDVGVYTVEGAEQYRRGVTYSEGVFNQTNTKFYKQALSLDPATEPDEYHGKENTYEDVGGKISVQKWDGYFHTYILKDEWESKYGGANSRREAITVQATQVAPTPPPQPPTNLKPPPLITIPPSQRIARNIKTGGKGLEGIITTISKQLGKIESGIDTIYYGDRLKKTGIKIPGTDGKQNGILPITVAISKIDLCHILSFLLKTTDINTLTGKDTEVAKKIKVLQDKARQLAADIQSGRFSGNALKNKQKSTELYNKLTDLSFSITDDTVAASPQLASAKSYIDDTRGTVAAYADTTVTYTVAPEIVQPPTGSTEGLGAQINTGTRNISTLNLATGSLSALASATTTNTLTGNVTGNVPTGSSTLASQAQQAAPELSYQALSNIPVPEIQRLLGKIRNIQSIVSSIGDMQTPQDAIDIAQRLTRLDINAQIEALEKFIDPSKLLPAFRAIANLLKSINQVSRKILGFVRILQVINKVAQVLVRVLNIMVRILSFIPIPNIVTIVTITQKFSDALQTAKKFIEATTKRINQIAALVDLIYRIIEGVVLKIDQLIYLVNIIISKLERCNARTTLLDPANTGMLSTVIQELVSGVNSITNVKSELNGVAAAYQAAQNDATGKQKVYQGYTLRIVEEEIVDEGVRYKRRKAIALDSRGVLVAETQLTFATDIPLLYEELTLILKNKGLLTETDITGGINLDFATGLENLPESLTASTSEDDIYESVGLTNQEDLTMLSAEVQAEVGNFVKGLKKGGRRFRRRVAQITARFTRESAAALKQSVKDNKYQGVSNLSNRFAANVSKSSQTVSTGSDSKPVAEPTQLSEEERARWLLILSDPRSSLPLRTRAAEILAKGFQSQD